MSSMDPNSVNVVIYHADCTDGFGAAYSAWKQLGNRAEYYPCKHGTPPPDVAGKNVVILDFSYGNQITKNMIKDHISYCKTLYTQPIRTGIRIVKPINTC